MVSLTSIAVDILGWEMSCMKTSLTVFTHVVMVKVCCSSCLLLATDTCWTRGAPHPARDSLGRPGHQHYMELQYNQENSQVLLTTYYHQYPVPSC